MSTRPATQRKGARQPMKLECLRCAFTWLPRIETRPVKCPNCQSRAWDKKPAR